MNCNAVHLHPLPKNKSRQSFLLLCRLLLLTAYYFILSLLFSSFLRVITLPVNKNTCNSKHSSDKDSDPQCSIGVVPCPGAGSRLAGARSAAL